MAALGVGSPSCCFDIAAYVARLFAVALRFKSHTSQLGCETLSGEFMCNV